jgi:nucleoid DNA-binding protein
MNDKTLVPQDDEGMLPEYDFSGGVRGKHYEAHQQEYKVVVYRAIGTREEYDKEEDMVDRVKQNDLAQRLAAHMESDPETAKAWLDGVAETLYECFRNGESVTITGLGNFYVRPEHPRWIFKFNPAQRLRGIFGW